ncbi:hypothetical protein [Bradyrhizobium sp. JR3.5]
MTAVTTFPILPTLDDLSLAFHQRSTAQLAADGLVIYGPLTSLVLTFVRETISSRRPCGHLLRLTRGRAEF